MKLVRFGPSGQEKPGAIDANGKLRDLSSIVPDIHATALSPDGLARLKAVDLRALPEVSGSVRYGVPVAHVPNLVSSV